MTINEALESATQKLKNKKIKIPQLDAEILLAHSIKKAREFILTHPEKKLKKSTTEKYEKLINRRAKNEPLALITRTKEFYGLDFEVNKHTLIPRPETELLVEQGISILQKKKKFGKKNAIIDLGTGSGCIIISVVKSIFSKLPKNDYSFFATDISKNALVIAKKNSKKHELEREITFLHGNLLEPLVKKLGPKIENHDLVIMANLPYLSKEIFSASPASVKNFEPKTALLAGTDGLDVYRKMFQQIKDLQGRGLSGCEILLEISPEQKSPLEKIIKKNFLKSRTRALKDLSGKWRIVWITI